MIEKRVIDDSNEDDYEDVVDELQELKKGYHKDEDDSEAEMNALYKAEERKLGEKEFSSDD